MHESEGVAYLMGKGVRERLAYDVVGHLLCSHTWIDLSRLHKAPVVDELHHIVVHQYRGVDYLACARVYPRWSHSVLYRSGHIAYAGVFQIVGIEVGVVLREVDGLHHILEAYLLESLVPYQYRLLQRLLPCLGESVVYIPHYRLLGFYQFAPAPCCRVLGLKSPAVGVGEVLDTVACHSQPALVGKEYSKTRVGYSRLHRQFWQQQ